MEFTQSEKDSFLAKLTEILEANLSDEQFGVSELARVMGMSRSNLHRKVKTNTNITVSQFIREMRLKRSLELLRESSSSISEVAINSGFSSLTYFTKCFKNYYGVPPSKYSKIEETDTFPDKLRNPQGKSGVRRIKAAKVWIIVALMTISSAILLILLLSQTIPNPFIREKTIAVLPYSGIDPDRGDAFLVDGLMNEIRHKLSLVEDLTVASRSSVERYRNTDKTFKVIGKDLDVNYILECKARNTQGRTLIELQLIDVENNKNFWAEPFKREISLDNIFKVQKEVILAVSTDLKAVMLLNEKEQMDRTPIEDLAAYNLFLIGSNYLNINIYSPDRKSSIQAIFKAKQSFEQAIELDSTFSDALASLGSIYINELYWQQFYSDLDKANDYLDLGMVFLNKALLYDKENPEALRGKAAYYDRIGSHEDASGIWKKLSNYGEPSYEYFQNEVMRYHSIGDYYATIESYQKYLLLKPEKSIQPPYLLRTLIDVFRVTGYYELEKLLAEQLLEFTRDSLEYVKNMVSSEILQGDFKAALSYAQETVRLDSTSSYSNWFLGVCYAWLEDINNALHYLVLSEEITKQSGAAVRPRYLSGYIYHVNGYETQSDYHFTGAIKRRQKEIEYATPNAQKYYSHFDLANIYLALGDEKKALEYIKVLDPPGTIDHGIINILINWPGLDNIRTRPEFLKVLEYLDNRYQKQHKRIGKLTEDLELNYL